MNLKKLAIGGLLALSATAASAVTYYTYYSDVYYYSDASYTTVVGNKITYCHGQGTETWGTMTAYRRTVERYRCDGPIP